jgi:hypothetical protein
MNPEILTFNGEPYRLLADSETVSGLRDRRDVYANGGDVLPDRWGAPSFNSSLPDLHKVYRVAREPELVA